MNQETSIEIFKPRYFLSQDCINEILTQFINLQGVKSIEVDIDFVKIEYIKYLLTSVIIKDSLIKGGFPFKIDSKQKSFL